MAETMASAAARDLLLELGTEEIPARFLPGAIEQLREKAGKTLADLRLIHGALRAYATPRRLTLYVEGVAPRQADLETENRGPAVQVAFDAAGKPTKAGEGFARGQGVAVEDLIRREVNGVDYVFARKFEAGKPALDVLPAALAALLDSLEFPKSMRWGDLDWRFARPVQWLLCLYGGEVVPVDLHGYRAGRTTYGHRTMGRGPIEIAHPGEYAAKLAENGVIVDPEERRARITAQLEALARRLGAQVPVDPDLLEEVVFIVEHPAAFAGSFDPAYLAIPQEVLITSMREHQRYFPVTGTGGKLLPHFIAVRNGPAEGIDLVRAGNEKVLRARLADAKFFYEEDQKRKLADRVDDLSTVVFLEKLGTMRDKTERLQILTGVIADLLGLTGAGRDAALRAAHLCKADLTTAMVREFTELQGVMGREYARLSGEPEAVSQAIFEHYLPRGAGDELPRTGPGRAVALADKLDTLAGCFALGMIPTGSADPYALRRAAQGVVLVLADAPGAGHPDVSLQRLIDAALDTYGIGTADPSAPNPPAARLPGADREQTRQALLGFFEARVRNLLGDRGFRYDLVDAVVAAGFDRVADTLRRAEALRDLVQTPAGEAVLAAFKRVNNLAQKAESARFDTQVMREPAELELARAYAGLAESAAAAADRGDYAAFYAAMAGIKPQVDAFLDGVLVMAEDPALRASRLGLLRSLSDLFSRPADLGAVVTG